jgi:hypothetical protein
LSNDRHERRCAAEPQAVVMLEGGHAGGRRAALAQSIVVEARA